MTYTSDIKPSKAIKTDYSNVSVLIIALRILIISVVISAFVPALNPARLSGIIGENSSLLTCAIAYSSIGGGFIRALSRGWISQQPLTLTYAGAVTVFAATLAAGAGACMTLGEIKLKRLGVFLAALSGIMGLCGAGILRAAYSGMQAAAEPDRISPILPLGLFVYFIIFAMLLLVSLTGLRLLPKSTASDKYEMHPKYRLFLMVLPFVALAFIFSYLPLWGWRYSLFDYKPGFDLTWDNFAGLKWFKYLFNNPSTKNDIVRVLKNTFIMSGLGIAMSWLPIAFAVFLSEIKASRPRRLIQSLTTIPNFISWVLVYSVAFALFSTEGFINSVLIDFGIIDSGTNFLMSGKYIWLKMWAWNTWKSLGWSAIIYLAAISGIDPQLYEAATVDGAGRFQKMRHVTVPGLTSTFFVLLLMSIANILSNGMDQYLVFKNPANVGPIEVLDLYVYTLGLGKGTANIPLATLIGMFKSIISVTLLFAANKFSSLVRGESIV